MRRRPSLSETVNASMMRAVFWMRRAPRACLTTMVPGGRTGTGALLVGMVLRGEEREGLQGVSGKRRERGGGNGVSADGGVQPEEGEEAGGCDLI